MDDVGGFVLLAAIGFGGEIGRVGFDEHAVERDGVGDGALVVLLEADDA